MTDARRAAIAERLTAELDPVSLRVKDQSHLHAGHAGARDGRGHFDVYVVATAFSGLPRLGRHRLIYTALGSLMETDIHALKIRALTPDEAEKAAGE